MNLDDLQMEIMGNLFAAGVYYFPRLLLEMSEQLPMTESQDEPMTDRQDEPLRIEPLDTEARAEFTPGHSNVQSARDEKNFEKNSKPNDKRSYRDILMSSPKSSLL